MKPLDKFDYICRYGLIHPKKCILGDPSSNNGWFYTSLKQSLGIILGKLTIGPLHCLAEGGPYWFLRLPGMKTPPPSRDEAMAMAFQSVTFYELLRDEDFSYLRKSFRDLFTWRESFIALLVVAWKTRKLEGGEKRNYIWVNKVFPAYKLSFQMMPWDVYFLKVAHIEEVTVLEYILAHLYIITTIYKKDTSELAVLFVQLEKTQSSYWINKIDIKSALKDRFPTDHPFNK